MIWNWVLQERTRRKWSQSELARRAGLSSQLISAGESGRKPHPSADTLARLAVAFGMTADDLMTRAGVALRSPTLPELRALAAGASPVAQQFLADLEKDYETVSDETWHLLTQVFQGQIARDRAKQIQQRRTRPAQDAPAEDAPRGSHAGGEPMLMTGC